MNPPTVGLDAFVADWHPEPVTVDDVILPRIADQLAATLDLGQRFAAGDALPLLWHWVFFLDWPATAQLGPDGHPVRGAFLPPIPDRRRMFAGGRVTVDRPLQVGERATRHSEIVGTALKHGRTGEMFFVTVRHTYRQDDTVCLVEDQDLVYRSDSGSATSFSRVAEPLAPAIAPWHASPHTYPTLLFRFSALTGNAHRIHYDEVYTTQVEGYPGLVVHGPLLAIYLAELVRAHNPGHTVAHFGFRLHKPVFAGDEIRVEGTPGEGAVDLAVVSGGANVHASARAMMTG
jgi:3-methylfumaryl-CoA hydratase